MDDLTKNVMKRVAGFEKRRVFLWVLSLVVIVLSLVVIGSVGVRQSLERGISDLVEAGVWDWVWEELPKVILALVTMLGVAVFLMWRNWPVVREKMKYLTKSR